MENVRQHTVPQCYLKNFAVDGTRKRQIFFFDKLRQFDCSTAIKDVGFVDRFYDILPELFSQEERENIILPIVDEKNQRVESILGEELLEIEKIQLAQSVHPKLAAKLAYCMTNQFLRSQDARKYLMQTVLKADQEIMDSLIALNFPEGYDLRPISEIDEKCASLLHADLIFNPKIQYELTQTLFSHTWVFGVPQSKSSIYTSDNPLVRRNLTPEPVPVPTKPKMNEDGTMSIGLVSSSLLPGFQEKGIEIFFPLNANLLLLLKERTSFPEYEMLHGRVVQIDTREVETNNRLQVEQSVRQIYCQSQDFDLARKVCAEKPEICDVERPRNKVESGMDKPTNSKER